MKVNIDAPAKVNLFLDIRGKRSDGYHIVSMVMQSVSLFDEITVSDTDSGEIKIVCSDEAVPLDESNTVYKAVELFFKETEKENKGIEIKIKKNIPTEAGLGGGSTDAAAVLFALNTMFDTELSRKELAEIGAEIGADVPFCIMRGTALAEGIGEVLTPLPAMPHCSLVIAKPKIHVSTKFVYGNLKASELKEHPDIDGQVQALREGSLEQLVAKMGNVLETVTVPAYPVIDEIKRTMLKNDAMGAMMSGSGPTVFGIFEREERAQEVCRLLKKEGAAKQVYLVRQ